MSQYQATDTMENFTLSRWLFFEASPLYNLDRSKLGRCSRQFSRLLNNAKHKKSSHRVYEAVFQNCSSITYSPGATECLKLMVLSDDTIIYTAYFIDWCPSTIKDEPGEVLPILLVQSTITVTNFVNNNLCELFDCDIQKPAINFKTVVTVFALLVHYSEAGEKGNATLKYKFPSSKENDVISVDISVKAATTLFQFLQDTHPDGDADELFYERVLHHIYSLYRLNFFNLNLISVSLPIASFSIDGLIKINTPEAVHPILVVLQTLTRKGEQKEDNTDPSVTTIE